MSLLLIDKWKKYIYELNLWLNCLETKARRNLFFISTLRMVRAENLLKKKNQEISGSNEKWVIKCDYHNILIDWMNEFNEI